MEQAVESVSPVHATPIFADDGWTGWWIRRLQPERPMGTVDVVMLNVDPKDLLQVAAPNDQQPVQALGPDHADPALGIGVGVGCLHRRDAHVSAVRTKDVVERAGELGVAVAEQDPQLSRSLVSQQQQQIAG